MVATCTAVSSVSLSFFDSSWFIDNQTNIVTYLINAANITGQTVTFNYNYEPCPPDGCPPPGIDYGPYESRYVENMSPPRIVHILPPFPLLAPFSKT